VLQHAIPVATYNIHHQNLLSNPDFTSGSLGIYGNLDGWFTYDPLAQDVIHRSEGQPETHTAKSAGINGRAGLTLNHGHTARKTVVYQTVRCCPKGTYTAFGYFKLDGTVMPDRLTFKVFISGREATSADVTAQAKNIEWTKVEFHGITVLESQTVRLQIDGDFVAGSGAFCDGFSLSFTTDTEIKPRPVPVIKPLTMPFTLYLNRMRSSVPELRYDPNGTQSFTEWQRISREKLFELLGMGRHMPCDDDLTVDRITEYPSYTQYRLSIQTEPGYRVPCYLSIPKDYPVLPPVAITLESHGVGISPESGFPGYFVSDGYAVFALEQRCFGESVAYCDTTSVSNILLRRTTVGNRVWDVMRCIDVLCAHFASQVDTERITCAGRSAGGFTALFAASLDTRILSIEANSSFCNFEDSLATNYQCLCYYIPGIRRFFEMSDLAGLIAPRRLILTNETSVFPKDVVEKAYSEARVLYHNAGAPNNIILA
jgi:hypothetical protein